MARYIHQDLDKEGMDAMNFVSGLLLYVLIWWVLIFVMLPLGIKKNSNPAPGLATGAPRRARIKKKLVITTLASMVVWGVVYGLVSLKVVDFRSIVRGKSAPPWSSEVQGVAQDQALPAGHPVHAATAV